MEHLIPARLIAGLSQPALLLVAGVAVALLMRGADWLVESASGLAYRLGVSKIIVGATIVSLGTTSPECAVSVMAAWSGEPGLALGNAIGSIIADTGLIFGLGCLISPLPADRYLLTRQGWIQFGSAALLAIICYGVFFSMGADAELGRWVGIVLLALLLTYMRMSIRWSRAHPEAGVQPQGQASEGSGQAASSTVAKLVVVGLVGLSIVLVSSRALILAVTELAQVHWHVPQVVIAATLVALGTSMPELVIGLTSVVRGHKEILVGNVIGADILNVLFVVGASALAAPLPILEWTARVPAMLLYVHLPTMLAILVLFRVFIHRANGTGQFQRWYGVPLVGIYLAYTVVQYAVS